MPDFTPPFATRESQASISVSDAQGRQVCSWPLGAAGERAREGARRKARMVVEALNAQARGVTLDVVDALSDEALATVFGRAYAEATVDVAPAGSLGDVHAAGSRAGAAAVRDHILRVLAEQAGDPEALAAIVEDTLSFDADWSTGEVRMSTNHAEVVQAVAARAVTPLAAEMLALRSAARTFMDHWHGGSLHRWSCAKHERLGAECTCGADDLARLLASEPSPLVRRIEAEARLGRIVFWRGVHDNSRAATDTEYRAALDALRALEGGGGA